MRFSTRRTVGARQLKRETVGLMAAMTYGRRRDGEVAVAVVLVATAGCGPPLLLLMMAATLVDGGAGA